MPKMKTAEIEDEYKQLLPEAEKFKKSLLEQINQIITDEKIKIGFPIQSRIKTLESIIQKQESDRFVIKNSLLNLQDLIGFRIVLLFNRDVDKVADLLKKNLKISKQYFTGDKLNNDQFGYLSKHYVAEIPDSWSKVPTLKGLEKFRAEIQLRTLSQHNWAETSNVLQYKKESNVPKSLLRSISRVSALLETVDLELERLLDERDNYSEEFHLNNGDQEILNSTNIELVLNTLLPEENKGIDENYSELLIELNHFNITTVIKLKESIKNNLDYAIKEDKQKVHHHLLNPILPEMNERIHKNVFYTHVGLVRIILSHIDIVKFTNLHREKARKQLASK